MKLTSSNYPFIDKKKFFENRTLVTIKALLGRNKQKRVMFLLALDTKEFVTDFNKTQMRKLIDSFGNDVKKWPGRKFYLESEKWTYNTFSLVVHFEQSSKGKKDRI